MNALERSNQIQAGEGLPRGQETGLQKAASETSRKISDMDYLKKLMAK